MKIKNSICLILLTLCSVASYAQQPDKVPIKETEPAKVEEPRLQVQVDLKAGQSETTADGLKATFISVDEDSRCPEGVNCIWAGNAKVSIEFSKDGAKPATLTLQTQEQAEPLTYLNYQIRLAGLTPYPKEGVAVDKKEYVAILEISNLKPTPQNGFSEPAGLPLELCIVELQRTYSLDFGGQTEEEYTAQIKPPQADDKPTLRAPKLPPAPKVNLALALHNTGNETLQIWIGGDATRLDLDLQGPGAISVDAQLMFTMEFRLPKTISLKPGHTWTMPIKELSYGMRGVEKRAYWTKPGDYTLAATFSTAISPAPKGAQKTGDDEEFGQVKLVSAPIQLSVVGKDEMPAFGKWENLFSNEKWYQEQRGEKRFFEGVLQAIPQDGMMTTLQRTSLYKLGDRTIYTGAKTHPALDALVGKRAVIEGKAVDMELEGQTLKEIWPAQIRYEPHEPF